MTDRLDDICERLTNLWGSASTGNISHSMAEIAARELVAGLTTDELEELKLRIALENVISVARCFAGGAIDTESLGAAMARIESKLTVPQIEELNRRMIARAVERGDPPPVRYEELLG